MRAVSVPRCSLALLALVVGWGCAGGQTRAPASARPLDEARAIRVMAASLASTGEQPEAGRAMRLPSGRSLRIDVGVHGRRYGIAYVTAIDLAGLSPSEDLPPHLPDGDLPIVQGSGADRDVVALVLLATDYLFDDRAGGQHARTAIAPENRMHRDVRDFVIQARARKLR